MSDETERAKEIDEAVKAADAKKRADAEEAAMAGEKLDTLLKCLDSLGKRMDEWEKKQADLYDDDPTAKSYPPSDMNPLNRGEDPDAPRPIGADSRADSIRADCGRDRALQERERGHSRDRG